MNTKAVPNATRPEDMEKSRLWLGRRMSAPETLPFSFVYGGQKNRGIPQAWNPVLSQRRIDANLVETVVEGSDPKTGLAVRVEITQYQDYPVVEWVVWLSNKGSQASPLIQDLLALDGVFDGDEEFLAQPGFDHEPVDLPLIDGVDHRVQAQHRGDQNARGVRLDFLGHRENFQAGNPGHLLVAQNDGEPVFLNEVQRFEGIGGSNDVVAFGP